MEVNGHLGNELGSDLKIVNSQQSLQSSESMQSRSELTGRAEKKPVATVAWMIIFGDAFHNFIDGLTIGMLTSNSQFSIIITALLKTEPCLCFVC